MKRRPYEKEWVMTPQAREFKDMVKEGVLLAHKLVAQFVHPPDDTRILVFWEEMTKAAEGVKGESLREFILALRDMACMVSDEDTPYTKIFLSVMRGMVNRKDEIMLPTGYRPNVEIIKARGF